MSAIRLEWGFAVVADVENKMLDSTADTSCTSCTHFSCETKLQFPEDHRGFTFGGTGAAGPHGSIMRRDGRAVGARDASASVLVLQQHVVRRLNKVVVVEVWMDPHGGDAVAVEATMPSGAAMNLGRTAKRSSHFEASCGGVHLADWQLVAACETFYHVRALCMLRGSKKRLIVQKRELHKGSVPVGSSSSKPWVEWHDNRRWNYSSLAEASVSVNEGAAGARCVGLEDSVSDCEEVMLLKGVPLDVPLVASLAIQHGCVSLPTPRICAHSSEYLQACLKLVRHALRLICDCELPFYDSKRASGDASPTTTSDVKDTCHVSSYGIGAVQFARCVAVQQEGSASIDILMSRVEPSCMLSLACNSMQSPPAVDVSASAAGVGPRSDVSVFRDSLLYHHEHNFSRIVYRALQGRLDVADDDVHQAHAACSEFGLSVDLSLLCSVVASVGPLIGESGLCHAIDIAFSATVATMFLPVHGTNFFVLASSAVADNAEFDGTSSARPVYWERYDAFPDSLERIGGTVSRSSNIPEAAVLSRGLQSYEEVDCDPCFVRFQLRSESGVRVDCGSSWGVAEALSSVGIGAEVGVPFLFDADEDNGISNIEGQQVVLRIIGATLPDVVTIDGPSAMPLSHARVFSVLRRRLRVVVESMILEYLLRAKLSTVVVELVRDMCATLPPALVSSRYVALEFVYPEAGMRLFTQELSSSSDIVFTAYREVFVASIPGSALQYWLIISPADAGVNVVLHHPSGSFAALHRDEIFERVQVVLLQVNHRVNQHLLLLVLNDVRIASALLIPAGPGDPDEGLEVLPEVVLSQGTAVGRAGAAGRISFRAGRARDRSARRLPNEFKRDAFSCPSQGIIRVRLFERTASSVAVLRQVLTTQALGMFVINNRSDMFVYSSKDSPIFYMRLVFEFPDARDGVETSSRHESAGVSKAFVKLELFGILPASTQVLDGLRRSIERCVADLNLQMLGVLLTRSAQFNIPNADARFIQPAGAPPSASLAWRLPERVANPRLLASVLSENIGAFLGPLNFLAEDEDDSVAAMESSAATLRGDAVVSARAEQAQADGLGMCHPVHCGTRIQLVVSKNAHPAVQSQSEWDVWMSSPTSCHPACILPAVRTEESAAIAYSACSGRYSSAVVSPACLGYFATCNERNSRTPPPVPVSTDSVATAVVGIRLAPSVEVLERMKFCFNYRPSGGVDDMSEVVGRGIAFVYLTMFTAPIPTDTPRDESFLAKIVSDDAKSQFVDAGHVSAMIASSLKSRNSTAEIAFPLCHPGWFKSPGDTQLAMKCDASVCHPASFILPTRKATFLLAEAWAPQHAAKMNVEALVRRAGVSVQQVILHGLVCATRVRVF